MKKYCCAIITILCFGFLSCSNEETKTQTPEAARPTVPILDRTVSDIDGNSYRLVTIGSQTWTKSNLNVSRYRNGDIIPQVTDPTQWLSLTTGAWCYHNNDPANGPIYGKLYNWYAVNDSRGLSPTGYHVPSDGEWTTLINFLGGVSVAGGKMKATTLWTPYNGIINTNRSGFTGLPGGRRRVIGSFGNIGNRGDLWSSAENGTTSAWYRSLVYDFSLAGSYADDKRIGFSVRCVRD